MQVSSGITRRRRDVAKGKPAGSGRRVGMASRSGAFAGGERGDAGGGTQGLSSWALGVGLDLLDHGGELFAFDELELGIGVGEGAGFWSEAAESPGAPLFLLLRYY